MILSLGNQMEFDMRAVSPFQRARPQSVSPSLGSNMWARQSIGAPGEI
jgi:hypothetical protein